MLDGVAVGRDLREPRARSSSSSSSTASRKRAASESPNNAAAAAEMPRRKVPHVWFHARLSVGHTKSFICLVVFSEEELAENILKTVKIFLLKRDCPTRSEWITKLCYVVNTCMNIHICYRYCCCGSGKISSNIWLPPTRVKKNAKPPSPALIVPPVPR